MAFNPVLMRKHVYVYSIQSRANLSISKAALGAEQPLGRRTSCCVSLFAPNDLEGQSQSTLFSIGFWRVPRYTFGANLVILARKRDELSRSQARFGSIWTVLAPNDLEGQGQSSPFSIGFWRVPRYTFGANLVILAQKRDELSCGQQISTDGQTDGHL